MDVETFEVTEVTTELKTEATEEQLALIEELGLTGQQSLLVTDDETDAAVQVCPYRLMTEEEYRVYKVLCPNASKVENFKAHAIPLRVLQVVAHGRTMLEVIGDLQVWHRKSSLVEDPVLVGVKSDYQWDRKVFILARWGSELSPFEQLKEQAGRLFKGLLAAAYAKIEVEVRQRLALIREADDANVLDMVDSISLPKLGTD